MTTPPTHTDAAARPRAGAPKPDPAALKAAREAAASASIGAQVILDFNSDAGQGARGGAGATIEENTMIRDANLIAVGLDPNAPSGPPTGEPWTPPVPPPETRHLPDSGEATKMSSLAAGIQQDMIPEPPASLAGAAARTPTR
jgi:hypothetical protein